VGHLGNNESEGNNSRDVLEAVQGIDLFIDGHDHKEVEEEVGGTLLVETGCYLHNIGVVAIEEGVPSAELVAAGSFEGVDEALHVAIVEEDARVSAEMNVVLGSTGFFLNGERNPGVRTQETNLGDFYAEAARWTASVELGSEVDGAIINGGGVRASIEAGDITLGAIKTVAPFGNSIVTLRLTGAQLLEALEAACQAVGTGDPLGAFPQVSGISFSVDSSVPYEPGPTYPNSTYYAPAAIGSRVKISDVGGRGFDENETYTIATTDFLCEGGDTYHAFLDAAEVEQPQSICFDYEALVSYLVEACDHVVPESYAEPKGLITITGLD
jgi:2',3'-cyclic-nucleotide 2'-phosphodiesterase (5'-nucleotidase family)